MLRERIKEKDEKIAELEDALKAVKIHLEGSSTDSPEHRAFILGLVNGVLGKGE